MKFMVLIKIAILSLLSCTYPYKDQAKIKKLENKIIQECLELSAISNENIKFENKQEYLIASIDSLPNIYIICFLENNKYEYIIFSKLYEGGEYFDIQNDLQHKKVLELNSNLKDYNLYIREVYSNGEVQINLADSHFDYCMIKFPHSFHHIDNRDSLQIVNCSPEGDCEKWDEFISQSK